MDPSKYKDIWNVRVMPQIFLTLNWKYEHARQGHILKGKKICRQISFLKIKSPLIPFYLSFFQRIFVRIKWKRRGSCIPL